MSDTIQLSKRPGPPKPEDLQLKFSDKAIKELEACRALLQATKTRETVAPKRKAARS